MRELKHQTQLHEKGCVTACLAMLLNEDQEKVFNEFHDKYMSGVLDVDEYLHTKGMGCLPTLSTLARRGFLSSDVYYLITVPLLHYPAALHQIIMYRLNDAWEILDPNKGYLGRKYYVHNNAGCDHTVEITSYVIEYEVWDK